MTNTAPVLGLVVRIVLGLTLLILMPSIAVGQTPPQCPALDSYGSDPTKGGFAKVNGISLYYEVYGSGPPILIHGNGGSIRNTRCQYRSLRHISTRDHCGHPRSWKIRGGQRTVYI